ncbi:MAG: S8 family serine peptidase [Candidatus Eremiobacterota bacterium]
MIHPLSPKVPSAPFVDGEVLVKLKPQSGLEDFADDYGGTVAEQFRLPRQLFRSFDGPLIRVKLADGMSVEQATQQMRSDPRVDYAEPNYTYELTATPDDLHPELWGLHNTGQEGGTPGADISAVKAWDVTTGSRQNGPIIAVIDTGVDYRHPDLVNNLWTNPGEIPGNGVDDDGNGVVDDVIGYDAYNDTGDPRDEHFHGTHVTGTICAEGNNGHGVTGVNWQGRAMCVKIFAGSTPSTNAAAILRGVSYATRMGARITSNSWGGGAFNQAIYDAFKDSPALHVCGAGNRGTDNDQNPFYPSGYDLDNLIAVAATDRNDQLARFSCYGKESVDLAAPGVAILSTVPDGGYHAYNGTSMATPHVTGVAGLILSAFPEATNRELRDRLLLSSDPLDVLADRTVSGGRLNAARAVEQDRVAPAAPNDLKAVETSPTAVTLQWTATGDDAWCGQASAYDLRVSERPIENFEEAVPVPTSRAGATGTLERATVNLEPSREPRTLHLGLRVLDNVGNASELRLATVEVPAQPPA